MGCGAGASWIVFFGPLEHKYQSFKQLVQPVVHHHHGPKFYILTIKF